MCGYSLDVDVYLLVSIQSDLIQSHDTGDMRGTMSIKFIELYRGNERNVTNSGCTTLAEGDSGYPLDLHIIEGNRKLELVFDSLVDAKRFVRALSLVSTSHNITVRYILVVC